MDKEQILNAVQQYILKGQTEKAIKELQKLIKGSPKDIRSHLKLGDVFLKNGDNEKAIDEYLRVAEVYEGDDLNFRAIAMYKKVLSINPKHIESFHKIAGLYLKEGYKGDAKNYYQSILKMRPNEQSALNAIKSLGEEPPKEVSQKISLVDPTIPKFSPPPEKRIMQEPFGLSPSPTFDTPDAPSLSFEVESNLPPDKDAEMHYHLGIAYKEMELFDYAISEFELASSNSSIRFDSYIMLGNCFMEKGAYDQSIEYYKKASELKGLSDDKLARIQFNLGLAYEANGMTSEALNSFYSALKLDPSSSEAKARIKSLQQK